MQVVESSFSAAWAFSKPAALSPLPEAHRPHSFVAAGWVLPWGLTVTSSLTVKGGQERPSSQVFWVLRGRSEVQKEREI